MCVLTLALKPPGLKECTFLYGPNHSCAENGTSHQYNAVNAVLVNYLTAVYASYGVRVEEDSRCLRACPYSLKYLHRLVADNNPCENLGTCVAMGYTILHSAGQRCLHDALMPP